MFQIFALLFLRIEYLISREVSEAQRIAGREAREKKKKDEQNALFEKLNALAESNRIEKDKVKYEEGSSVTETTNLNVELCKSQICRNFFNPSKGCKKGDECRFSHIQLEGSSMEDGGDKGRGETEDNQHIAGDKNTNIKKGKKQEKSNRKRARERDFVNNDDKICPAINLGNECKFGDNCHFTHDVVAFLAKKPEDIKDRCILYDLYGECPNGLSCRFGNCHIDKETGKPLKNPTGLITQEINQLSQDTKVALRKKKYFYNLNTDPYPMKEVKLVDFSNKVWIIIIITITITIIIIIIITIIVIIIVVIFIVRFILLH